MNLSVLATLLRVVVCVACLILAMLGFAEAFPAHGARPLGGWLDIAYQAVQLIFGQFPAELKGRPIPLPLQIARFALPATAATVTLSLCWEHLRNPGRSALVRRHGAHLVVFGEGALARGLVRGERARKGAVVAWVEEAQGPAGRDAEAQGAVHAAGPAASLDLRKLGLESARTFVATADSDAANLAVARRVIDFALERRTPGDPLQVIARIDDVALQDALQARLTRRDQRDRVELRLASVPQLLARQMLLANPVDRVWLAGGERVRLCWVGWSPLAETMLVRVLAGVHFRASRTLELVVLDRDAEAAEQALRSRRPEAFDIAPICFAPLRGAGPNLVAGKVVEMAQDAPFAAVYLTGADPSAVLATGLALETAFARHDVPAPAIYVYQPEVGEAPTLVEDSLVRPFGAVSGLADPEALLQERADGLAKAIHAFYLEGRLNDGEALGDRPTLAAWKDLPEAVRDDNRLVADCYLFKLRDLGAAVVEGEGPSLRFTADEVESLSEAEHRRWMAAKRLDGWTRGAVRDDAARRHPDIIPYPDLSERIKELDREQVRMIPRILAASGRRALRDLTAELRPAPGRTPTLEEVRASLDMLAQQYPDRRLVVQADPADRDECAVLLHARRLGHACRLVSTTPLPAIVDAVPAADRGALVQLIRGAEGCMIGGPASAFPPAEAVVDLGMTQSPGRSPALAAAGL